MYVSNEKYKEVVQNVIDKLSNNVPREEIISYLEGLITSKDSKSQK